MATVLVTRHPGLQEYLKAIGAINEDTTVLCHCTVDQIRGQNVIGVLPLHLAVECASITEYPLNIPFELRGTEISAEDMPKYVGKPVTYKVLICPAQGGAD